MKKWLISVVVLVSNSPREFKSFYMGVEGTEEEAASWKENIAKTGFIQGGDRFFPDQIETITYREQEVMDDLS